MNDTLDIFNIKEKELGNLDRFGTIGDMDGYDFELRYGLSSKDSIFINYQLWNINYGDSILKNKRIELLNRYNLFYNKNSFFNSLSIDFGYVQNSSSPIDIKNDKLLNSLIKKIKPNTSVRLDNGTIISKDSTITLYDSVGNLIYPYLSIENLKSDSYVFRVLLAKKLSTSSLIDFYIGYKLIDIKTSINFYPDNNSMINNLTGDFKIPNLDRKEKNIELGLVYTLKKDKFIYELNYEYNKILRDDELSFIDNNHIINAIIAKNVGSNILIYIGGKMMLQQFNTDIPYLYNKYTKTQFDKKYGFAQFGFVYKF